MAKLFVRIAGALGITGLVLFFVGLIPFFADPTAGAGIATRAPSVSVNRQFKGDRLPVAASSVAPRGLSTQQQSSKPARMPVGCEGAFSPISSPRLAHVIGRCMT